MLDIITTVFEVVGLLLLAVGCSLALAPFTIAGAVALGGAVLLVESTFLVWLARRQ